MNKLITFTNTLKKSLTNPGYYEDVLAAPYSFSLKYLFALLFFISFVQGIVFTIAFIPTVPKIPGYVEESKQIMRNLYPTGLTITIKDGSLRTNVDEPYFIPFPSRFKVKDMSLVAIDTKASVDSFKRYNTAFLVTKNALAYPDSDTRGSYKVYPFSDLKGFLIINREAYERVINPIIPYFKYYPLATVAIFIFFLMIVPIFGSLFAFSGTLFYLLVLTLVTYLIAKFMKLRLTYSQILHLGIHGLTFSLLFSMLKTLMGITIPYTYTAPFIIWMIIVFNQLKKHHDAILSPSKSTK
ncbi:DUF1189 family protein [Candidatus Roizmanbacteria bacterium]|nr:DUF1189 family protein [Candidatus Roizmanbacteria bacterium]